MAFFFLLHFIVNETSLACNPLCIAELRAKLRSGPVLQHTAPPSSESTLLSEKLYQFNWVCLNRVEEDEKGQNIIKSSPARYTNRFNTEEKRTGRRTFLQSQLLFLWRCAGTAPGVGFQTPLPKRVSETLTRISLYPKR